MSFIIGYICGSIVTLLTIMFFMGRKKYEL